MLVDLIIIVYLFGISTKTNQSLLLENTTKTYSNRTFTSFSSKQRKVLHANESQFSRRHFYNDGPSNTKQVKYSGKHSDQVFLIDTYEEVTFSEVESTIEAKGKNTTEILEPIREYVYNKTEPEQYPYAVYIVAMNEKNRRFNFCSGSLLSLEWVVTAAQCLKKAHYFWVYAGGTSGKDANNFLDNNAPLPEGTQMIRSKKFMPHPQYVPHKDYDVALIELQKKFNLSAKVDTVQISTIDFSNLYSDNYKRCVSTAFGMLSYQRLSPDDLVRKTQIIDAKKPCNCLRTLMDITDSDAPRNYLCQKPVADFGLCDGDTGGGLLCDNRIIGINMMQIYFTDIDNCKITASTFLNKGTDYDCGDRNEYYIFQEISPSFDWIETVMNGSRMNEEVDDFSGSLKPVNSCRIMISAVLINAFIFIKGQL